MEAIEYLPGEPAPVTGDYHELNVFGRPTGWSRYLQQGETLPALPRGFTWRHVPAPEE
jgi:hypothetical protein